MRSIFLTLFLSAALLAQSQKQQFDALSFTPPAGWTKDQKENLITYTRVDQQKNTWCKIAVIKSTVGKGSIDNDFQSEWKDLAVTPYQVSGSPSVKALAKVSGWNVKEGSGSFSFDGKPTRLTLRTFSAGDRCASILVLTNSESYRKAIDDFLASVRPQAVQQAPVNPPTQAPPVKTEASKPMAAGNFQFNTTNFDDGWTSVVKEEWVEATKGNVKVLLHYPRAEDKKYISQHDEATRFFWNLYVAPRYSNIREFWMLDYNMSYEPATYANAYLTDITTGKEQFVTLFSKGRIGYIEIITPDRASFVKAFGVDKPDTYFSEWTALQNLAGLNKFAVGENDLPGKWSNTFSAANSLYNIYSGIYVGATTYASAESFTFGKNRTYNWHIVSSSGGTGMRTDIQQVKRDGTFKMVGNWQIWFSTMQFKAKTYNAYFSCIKGGRVLWLQDTEYGSYTAYGRVE